MAQSTSENGAREDPEKTLWMGDLAYEWDEAFITHFFDGFGQVKVFRPYDQRADRPALYAFVTFESAEDCARAYEELNGSGIPETRRRFRLNPRSRRPPPGGGGGGYRDEGGPRKRQRSWSPPGGPYDRRSPPGGYDRRPSPLGGGTCNAEQQPPTPAPSGSAPRVQ